MKVRNATLLTLLVILIIAAWYATTVVRGGFSSVAQPSKAEVVVAQAVRNWGIPGGARGQKNPWPPTADLLQEARNDFTDHCAGCHGKDGDGRTGIGQNLYPKAPDLRRPETQDLTDGEIHWIIQNGVRLTGMPAFGNPHGSEDDNSVWKLVLFVRSIAQATPQQIADQNATATTSHYVGSAACQKCHTEIYEPLEEDADGQCGARSPRASGRDHSQSRY